MDSENLENIKNFPLIYKLSEIELENLSKVVLDLKSILNNDYEITKFLEIFNKIKLETINTEKKTILDVNYDNEINKRADELSKQYNLELSNNLDFIKTKNDELEDKLLNRNKQLKEKDYELDILKKQINGIQSSLNNIEHKHEEKINKINEQYIIKEEKLKEEYNKNLEKLELKNEKLGEKNEELNNKLISTFVITNNSQRKGVNGENITENLYVPDGWTVNNKSKENNSGDHQFINPDSNNIICVDTKNYTSNIPSKEVDKLIKDTISTNSDAGIIISQHTSISWYGKPIDNITHEYINSKHILFIPSACNLTPETIKNFIILFDKIITTTKSDGNIVNINMKLTNTINSLNNIIGIIQLQKDSFKTLHNSFIKNHNKSEKYINNLENEINEIILNINKDIKINDDDLSEILKKSDDAGHSVQEISILKQHAIKNMNSIETFELNSMNNTSDFQEEKTTTSEKDEEIVITELNEPKPEPEQNENIKNNYNDIEQFIIENINTNDKNNGQYNSVRDIKKVFIGYCIKISNHDMVNRFKSIKEEELSNIIIRLGYTKQTTYGKNYKNNSRKKGNKTYNINLIPINI